MLQRANNGLKLLTIQSWTHCMTERNCHAEIKMLFGWTAPTWWLTKGSLDIYEGP